MSLTIASRCVGVASAPALLTRPGALDTTLGGTELSVEVLDRRNRLVARSLSLGGRVLPAAKLAARAIRHREIHELRNAGIVRTSRSLVLRNDHVGENADRAILRGSEEFGSVGVAFGSRAKCILHKATRLLLLGGWPAEKSGDR